MSLYPHNEQDCHGSRCPACGCCMHSKFCNADGCWDRDCGCYGRRA